MHDSIFEIARKHKSRSGQPSGWGGCPLLLLCVMKLGFCIAYDCTCTSICGNGITMPFSSKARFTPSLMSKNTSQ